MSTSPTTPPATPPTSSGATSRPPIRLELLPDGASYLRGAWWPRSRDLQVEAADLVDHFPASVGRISRLLFSRPDWDDSTLAGRGVRRIQAHRGPVKVGSFPDDDTHLMVLTMASGERLRLMVVDSGTERSEGERRLRGFAVGGGAPDQGATDRGRRDEKSPSR